MDGIEILKSTEKFKINLGLGRVRKMLEFFGNPQKELKVIHVAGTNGKGSVCAILERIFIEDGRYKVGKYTSPHLFKYNERFSINGNDIEDEELDFLIKLVNEKDIQQNLGLSEFEILTVVAFLYFKKNNVDYAIMETGLGGRLDAVNVIEKPLISVITSISFDHKERLGDTIEKIAYEKSGIIKPKTKCVFLKSNKGYRTLKAEALKKGAQIVPENLNVEMTYNVALIDGEVFEFNLNGDFQAENLKLAILCANALKLNFSKTVLSRALKNVRWKFRMESLEYKGHNLLIDGCHNPDGARVLSEYLQKYHNGKKIKFIFGCLSNKDYNEILKTLYKNEYDFCFYEFNHKNALKFEEIKDFKLKKIENPISEIERGGYDLCVVSGSLYMLGEIFKDLF